MADQSKYIWFNGEVVPWERAQIHVMSHVLHYGSGVFEGIKCYKTSEGPAIFRLPEHINRLFQSAIKYGMEIPYNQDELFEACKNIVEVNEFENCYIRPIAFYGYDTLGVYPKDCPVEVAIASFFWGAYLGDDGVANGVNITISPWKRLSLESFPASAKASGQYLNSLLAVQDARKRGYDEALLLNQQGNVAEGSGQNLFIVKNNTLYTNDESASILLGITRDTIIQVAQDIGYEVCIQDISTDDLFNADEAFFAGSASEVTPIATIDDNPVGAGEPGPVSLELRESYLDIIHGRNERYNHWLSFVHSKEILESAGTE
ncbi:MAG: branched-chain amino acid transaminase [Candidatus Marinimicrobia bacterium]|jgi:branched-chain amino acid aminotransferase|nr:branched-chain amino acid transaminase [Candidatus Neomarinimicrobiota bacterium]MDP6936849.1 branched-chain amino acid transaminase [Candidatus Neomarinimicrobiota bacterium]